MELPAFHHPVPPLRGIYIVCRHSDVSPLLPAINDKGVAGSESESKPLRFLRSWGFGKDHIKTNRSEAAFHASRETPLSTPFHPSRVPAPCPHGSLCRCEEKRQPCGFHHLPEGRTRLTHIRALPYPLQVVNSEARGPIVAYMIPRKVGRHDESLVIAFLSRPRPLQDTHLIVCAEEGVVYGGQEDGDRLVVVLPGGDTIFQFFRATGYVPKGSFGLRPPVADAPFMPLRRRRNLPLTFSTSRRLSNSGWIPSRTRAISPAFSCLRQKSFTV